MQQPSDVTEPIFWQDDELILLDQRRLPLAREYVTCRTARDVCQAIADMVVRGAPAIGVSAAYGVVLAVRDALAASGPDWREQVNKDIALLAASRPTAVNLAWALEKMAVRLSDCDADTAYATLRDYACRLHADDVETNRIMGKLGAECLNKGARVLTHCNAGALATAGYGTALGVIRSAWSGRGLKAVYATETRPWLQGARLTAWELIADHIDVTLIADSAAAWLMAEKRIDWVITGADRVAANGDTANKIGTYALATIARAHGVKFMIVAPTSTIDRDAQSAAAIPIEHRDERELTHLGERQLAAPGVRALNPVFDLTPASLIDYLVTEKGVVTRPNAERIAGLFDA